MPQRLATTDEILLAARGAADDVDPSVLEYWASLAATMRDFTGAAWGEKGSFGHALLTLEMLMANGIAAAEGTSGPIGSVIARDFGELKEKYGPVEGGGSAFGSTSFGSQFGELESTVLNFSAVAGGRTWWPLGGWI